MAGSIKTSRRSGGGNKMVLALLVIGASALAAAAWFVFFKDKESAQPTEAEKMMGLDTAPVNAGRESGAGEAAPSTVPSINDGYAKVDQTLASVARDISGRTGADRQTALVAGYRQIAALLESPLPPTVRGRVLPQFHAMTDELFFSNLRNEFSDEYVVKPGDSVAKIAKKTGATQELICRWNNIVWEKRASISVNDSFKFVKGTPRVLVDKSDFCLSFYFGDCLVRQYIIAHGKGNNTPEGSTTVDSKIVDPDTQPRVGPAQQEMDERWIGFANINGRTGFGIHGTKHEDSIPGETSKGCVRMFNKDVVELYDWVPMGMKVDIRG